MMTNLLAIVVVTIITTTNDIHRWTPQICRDGSGEWTMYIDEAAPKIPLIDVETGKTNVMLRFPTIVVYPLNDNERVRIIQTKKINHLSFEWGGKKRDIIDEEILDETRSLIVRNETWIKK